MKPEIINVLSNILNVRIFYNMAKMLSEKLKKIDGMTQQEILSLFFGPFDLFLCEILKGHFSV